MSQRLSLKGFKWVEDLSEFNENFIKVTTKKVYFLDKRYFIEVDVQYFENLDDPHNDLLF